MFIIDLDEAISAEEYVKLVTDKDIKLDPEKDEYDQIQEILKENNLEGVLWDYDFNDLDEVVINCSYAVLVKLKNYVEDSEYSIRIFEVLEDSHSKVLNDNN
jgi:hypothetical protein